MANNDLNRTMIVGRLTRDIELKETSGGAKYCNFSIANNQEIYKKDADNIKKVGFYDCQAWGHLAELVAKYLVKGKRIGIDGKLDFSEWTNSEGKKCSQVKIKVENIQFLDSRSDSVQSPQSNADQVQDGFMGAQVMSDSDIPF